MILNLTALRSELGQKIKRTNLANARLDRWLNMAVDDIYQDIDSDHLIVNYSFSTVSAIRVYYIPDIEFNRILSVVDTTNQNIILPRNEYDIEEIDAGLNDSGTPYYYSTFGYAEFEGQPLTASTVNIVSNSAADLTQRVRITGLVNGVAGTEILTLNGLTAVTGTSAFTEINAVRKDLTTVGRVRVTVNDASTTRIADIAPAALARMYQPIYLFNVPDSIINIRVRGLRKVRPLVNAEDFPDVPDAYSELVLIGAAIRGHRDLFDFTIARKILEEEWIPMMNKFKKQQGNKRGRKSPVIGEGEGYFELGRLPPRFGILD